MTRGLMDPKSLTRTERGIGELLYNYLFGLAARTGRKVDRMTVDRERLNLFAAWALPEVVLSAHMDTVPPFFPSSEDAELAHGRGACDKRILQGRDEIVEKAIESL